MNSSLPSGSWVGHYEQYGEEYPTSMELRFDGHEIQGQGNDIGPFEVVGSLEDGRVTLEKNYQGPIHTHRVQYTGRVADNQIEGEWCIGSLNGTFRLRPDCVAPDKELPRPPDPLVME